MAVSVGRIRSSSSAVSLVLLVHNTVRGAAGTCVLAAELAVREKLAA
jgi:aspartate-semialdehyde dehydrogenase